MGETKENKKIKTITIIHFIEILLLCITLVASALGIYAWARYTSYFPGTTTAQVAKWHFELKDGSMVLVEGEDAKTLLALTRTDERTRVVDGLLAPGTYGELPIVIDTTTTEVDLKYELEVTIENCPQNITFTTTDASLTQETRTGDGAITPRVATIKISKYIPYTVTDANRIHNETITWNWPYQTGAGSEINTNDRIDTIDSGKEVTVSVRVTGYEVIGTPLSMSTIKDNDNNVINAGDTITLYTGDEPTSLNFSDGMEAITCVSSESSVATVTNRGVISPVSAGTSVITITGSKSEDEVEVNVVVKPAVNAVIGGNPVRLTETNTGTNYGRIVTNYTANGQTYQLFYIDYNGDFGEKGAIYLKAANNVTRRGLDTSSKSVDADTVKMKNMNPLWAKQDGVANNNSEKAAVWLTDTDVWSSYCEKEDESIKNYVDYAIGAPSLEMFVKSYNEAAAGTSYQPLTLTCTNGSYSISGYTAGGVGRNSMYYGKVYWSCTPSYESYHYSYATTGFSGSDYIWVSKGIEPVICLKPNFPLQLQ